MTKNLTCGLIIRTNVLQLFFLVNLFSSFFFKVLALECGHEFILSFENSNDVMFCFFHLSRTCLKRFIVVNMFSWVTTFPFQSNENPQLSQKIVTIWKNYTILAKVFFNSYIFPSSIQLSNHDKYHVPSYYILTQPLPY